MNYISRYKPDKDGGALAMAWNLFFQSSRWCYPTISGFSAGNSPVADSRNIVL